MHLSRAWRILLVFVALTLFVVACAPTLSDLQLSATETASAPTPPPAPEAPTLVQAKRQCHGDFRGGNLIWVEDVALTWQDNASTETGFVVYRNGVPQDVLPPDSVKDHLQFRYNQGVVDPALDTFAVEAIRDSSSSSRATIAVPRCH